MKEEIEEISIETIKQMNVFQRVHAIMENLDYIQKTGNIQAGKSSYSAVLHDHVTKKVQPYFVKFRLCAVPTMEDVVFDRYEVQTKYGTSDRYEIRVNAKLKIVNIDDPSDTIETNAYALAFDSQDKAPGKAFSLAVKYCYLKLLMLASGDQEEERVEEAKVIKGEKDSLKKELTQLLKRNGKWNNDSIKFINNMNVEQLCDAIKRNKGN
jgi:hypothetical protein